jgi:hypothetical protein
MLDAKEEAKREQLKAKCREMKVLPPSDIFIGLQVHEKGKLIFDDIQRGHSWTRNYWNSMFAHVSNCSIVDSSFGAGYISCKDTAGTFRYQANTLLICGKIMVESANVTNGIVVGTGTSAFDVEQYALDALIESGSSAGKLYYNTSVVSSTTYASKKWTVVGSRIFNNNSGSSIVVAETGLHGAQSPLIWLMERSVLSPAVTVPDGAQLTVTYTIVDDFSAID